MRPLQPCFRVVTIDLRHRQRFLGEDRAALWRYLGEPALDEEPLQHLQSLVADLDGPWPQRRQERRVPGEHPEIAGASRDDHQLHVLSEDGLRRRDNLKLKRICHRRFRLRLRIAASTCPLRQAASSAIFFAFSTASLMVPTM